MSGISDGRSMGRKPGGASLSVIPILVVTAMTRSGRAASVISERLKPIVRPLRTVERATRISATFNCIEHERVVRRKCGRQLSRLLSHLAAGKNYEAALKSADAIGTALEQVAAAVSLQEVESIRKLGKRGFASILEEV